MNLAAKQEDGLPHPSRGLVSQPRRERMRSKRARHDPARGCTFVTAPYKQGSAKVRERAGEALVLVFLMGAMTDEEGEERTEQGAGFPRQGSRSREDGHIVQ